MKIATQCALAGGLLLAGIAHACATPVEIEGCQPSTTTPQDCDVILARASDFGGPDASVPGGAGGNGGDGANPQGGAGSGANPPPGGNAGSPPVAGSGGVSGTAGSNSGAAGAGGSAAAGGAAGSGAAGSGAAGSGAAGSGAAGTSSGGAAGAGAGGAAGSGAAGSGAAGSGSAGTGSGGTGSQSIFNPASCDFDDLTGCEDLGCNCPEERCGTRCTNIVTCLSDNITCITEADPLCAIRNNGTPNTCTTVVETGGGVNADNNQPSGIVRELVNCVCSDPRP